MSLDQSRMECKGYAHAQHPIPMPMPTEYEFYVTRTIATGLNRCPIMRNTEIVSAELEPLSSLYNGFCRETNFSSSDIPSMKIREDLAKSCRNF